MYLKDLLIASLFSILLLSCGKVIALDDFSSDGCSQFPDGTFSQEDLWCDCCITHDIAYWQGGSRQQKNRADHELRACVVNKTGNLWLADLMYYGVTFGGLPQFPTWYRWGYGWHYGRGFQLLNAQEQQEVSKKLTHALLITLNGECHFEHPIKLMIEQKIHELLHQ